jgi:hypothetical protein
MELALLLSPLLIPALGFATGYMLGGRQITMGIAGACAFGLLAGAFIGSAASAMSTAQRGYPMLQGGAAGTAAGLATGMLIAAIIKAVQVFGLRRKT